MITSEKLNGLVNEDVQLSETYNREQVTVIGVGEDGESLRVRYWRGHILCMGRIPLADVIHVVRRITRVELVPLAEALA